MRFAFWRSGLPPVKTGGVFSAPSAMGAGVRIRLFPWLLLLTGLSCITAIAQLVVLVAVWEGVYDLNQQLVILRLMLSPIRIHPALDDLLT